MRIKKRPTRAVTREDEGYGYEEEVSAGKGWSVAETEAPQRDLGPRIECLVEPVYEEGHEGVTEEFQSSELLSD